MRIKLYFLAFVALCFTIACNKEPDFNYPEGTVGRSKITNFPILTLLGDEVIVLEKGTPFTDPGVTAKEGTNDLTPAVSGEVDINTPGVYTITYSAVNKDGFSATTTRTVVVYETDDTAASHDLSGNYARTTNGSVAEWTKLAPGVYSVFNPGGAPGTNLTVIVFNPSGYTIFIPEQVSSDGSITSSSNESYTPGSPAKYSWKIVNPGYGTALRTFVKQ
jgi:hypothetical protein